MEGDGRDFVLLISVQNPQESREPCPGPETQAKLSFRFREMKLKLGGGSSPSAAQLRESVTPPHQFPSDRTPPCSNHPVELQLPLDLEIKPLRREWERQNLIIQMGTRESPDSDGERRGWEIREPGEVTFATRLAADI